MTPHVRPGARFTDAQWRCYVAGYCTAIGAAMHVMRLAARRQQTRERCTRQAAAAQRAESRRLLEEVRLDAGEQIGTVVEVARQHEAERAHQVQGQRKAERPLRQRVDTREIEKWRARCVVNVPIDDDVRRTAGHVAHDTAELVNRQAESDREKV